MIHLVAVMHFSKFLNKFLSVAIILHGEAKQRNSRHEITRHVNYTIFLIFSLATHCLMTSKFKPWTVSIDVC